MALARAGYYVHRAGPNVRRPPLFIPSYWRLAPRRAFPPFFDLFLSCSLSLPPIPRAGPYCDHCLEGHACARANPCAGAQLRLTESEISIGIIAGARLFAPREREKRKHGEFELLKFTISPGHSLGARGLVKFHD